MTLMKKDIEPLPDAPVYVGDRPAVDMDLSIITYDTAQAKIEKLSSVDELTRYKKSPKTLWINITGLKDVDSIKRLGDLFDIHPLTIEDILNTEQQPKMEIFNDYRFLSLKSIRQEKKFLKAQENKKFRFSLFNLSKDENTEDEDLLIIEQISLIIKKNVIITFQEIAGDSFDGIRKKILENVGEMRKAGTDYLAYSIIDAVVDEYFIALNNLEDIIEDFEERAVKSSDNTFIEQIQNLKMYLVQIKRAVLPLEKNMLVISHHGMFFKSDNLKPFIQDLSEHINHVMAMLENHREWLTNIMEVNLSVLSHQTNKVMKVLAIISTIFIPLTFIAGVYGMNFQYMPELGIQIAYPIVLGGMGLIALIMVVIFKIHRWF